MRMFVLVAILAAYGATASAQAGPPGGGPGAMLGMADANNDGTITRAEFDAARAARFAQADANSDGSLAASERPQPRGGGAGEARLRLAGMHPDADNNGVVTRAEYDAQGARMFERIDTNNDNAISQSERDALPGRPRQ